MIMNIKKCYLAVCCFSMLLALLSAEWQGRPRKNNSKVTVQNGITKVSGPETHVMTSKFFDVSPGKQYKISGEIRVPKGSKRFYFGIVCYDAKGRHIQGGEAAPVIGSDTVLIKPVKKGDRVILVKDASKWQKRAGSTVAFNTKKGYADLPNRDLSRGPVTHIEKAESGNHWEITLRLPFRKTYPAGIGIRQQIGAAYLFLIGNRKVGSQWQKFSATADCRLRTAQDQFKKGLYPGTRKIRFVLHMPGRGNTVEMKNIQIKPL